MALGSRHRRILVDIFTHPTRADVDWDDFVRLYLALGGDAVKSGSGSVRRFRLNGVKAAFHEPHPTGIMKKGAVDSARLFLANAGISPANEERDRERRGRGGAA